MGALVALAYALLGALRPGLLVAALLLGTAVDWPFHAGSLVLYSNELALAGAVLGLGIRQAWRRDLPPLPLWLLAAGSLPLLWTAAHMLGPTPTLGLKDALRAAQFVLGVLLPLWLLRGAWFERSRLGAVAFILAAVALGIAQAWAGPGAAMNAGHEGEVFYGMHQAAASFFQHHNQFGAFLAAAVPFSVAAEAPLLALGGLAALYASYSRGASLGLILGLVPQAWAYPWRRTLTAATLLGLALAGGMALSPALRLRAASVFDAANNSDRALLRGIGRDMAAEGSAWWGRGPGTVQAELPQRLERLELRPQDRAMFQSHLHDQWLQWRVELGWPGVLAWAVFFGALVATSWRRLRPGLGGRAYALALAVAVIAFAAQAFTDRLALHARGLDIALLWGLCLAGMHSKDADA